MKKLYQSLEDNSTNNMKQVIYRNLTSKILYLGFILLLTFSTSLNAQDGDAGNGKSLFNSNCAACHKLDAKMTGPALRNVEALLEEEGKDRAWINKWIRNSSAVIKSGDAYAVKLYNEYGKTAMTAFPQLSDQDISDILAYTAAPPATPPPPTAAGQTGGAGGSGTSNNLILAALALLFGLLAIALVLVNRTLNRFADERGIEVAVKETTNATLESFCSESILSTSNYDIFLISKWLFCLWLFNAGWS